MKYSLRWELRLIFHAGFSLKFVDAEMIEVELAQNAYKCSITYLSSVAVYVHGLYITFYVNNVCVNLQKFHCAHYKNWWVMIT